MEQPIKYSDLIAPDDSIDKLIEGLEKINEQYARLAESIKKEAAGMSSSLANVSGATEQGRQTTKATATEADRLAKEYAKLEQAMGKNAKEIARLNAARKQMNSYQKLIVQRGQQEIRTTEQIAQASYKQLSAQYALNKAYINQLTAKDRNIRKNKELIESTRQIYEQMKRLQEQTGKHQLNVGNYPSLDLKGMATGLTSAALGVGSLAAAGTMAVSALKDGVGTAMDFEAAVSKLSAILGITKDDMKELIEQARQLGATTIFTAQEVAQLQTELAKLGYSKEDIVEMTQSVLLFAQATDASLADAASLAGAALRMFEKETESTQEFVDKMAASTNKSALSFSFLQNALSTVSPVANAFGFKIEDVLALLGQLANAGFDASSAATATRNILLNLADSSGKLAKSLGNPVNDLDGLIAGLQKLEKNGVDLATSLELTDKRSVAAFQTFLKGANDVLSLRDALNDADGTAQKMAITMGDNLSGAVKSMNSAWQDLMIEINNGQGILRKGVDALTESIRGIASAYKRVREYFSELYDESVAFRTVVDAVWKSFEQGYAGVALILETFWLELKGVAHLIKGVFTLDWSEIEKGWDIGVTKVFDNIRNKLYGTKEEIKDTANTAKNEKKKLDKEVSKDTGGGNSTKKLTDKELKALEEKRKKQEKEQKEANKRSIEIQRAYEDAFIALIEDGNDKERAQLITKYDRQIEDLRNKLKEEKKLTETERTNINNTILLLEQQKYEALADLEGKFTIQAMERRKKESDLRAKGDNVNDKLNALEQQKKLDIEKNRQLKKGQISEKLIIEGYEREKQQILYDYGLKQIDMETELRQSEIDAMKASENKKTELRLQAEKERLKKIYDLNVKNGKNLNSLEMQILRQQMAAIDKEVADNKKDGDLWDKLGFNLDDGQKDALSESFNFAIENVNAYMQAWVEAANAKVEAANKEVDAAQNALNAEREARANGYASNVAYAQKELDMAKKNQAKALQEQQKAQRAQAAVQSVQQATNLVSASALIWSQLGFPWAIPAIAIMWGSFAAAKIKAAQVSRSSEQYGEGTVELLEGGSHQSGNDIDLGRKKDGTRRRAEGGEYFAVINKRNSRKYRSMIPTIIKSLNNGTFEQKYQGVYEGGQQLLVGGGESDTNLQPLMDDVTAIREQGERRQYTDGSGVHEIYKNLHRIILN